MVSDQTAIRSKLCWAYPVLLQSLKTSAHSRMTYEWKLTLNCHVEYFYVYLYLYFTQFLSASYMQLSSYKHILSIGMENSVDPGQMASLDAS